MIKINSIRLKCLLFELFLITLLISIFGYFTLNLVINDKTNQLKESIAFQNVTNSEYLKGYGEKILLISSIIENEYYAGRLIPENSSFFRQFSLLQSVELEENSKTQKIYTKNKEVASQFSKFKSDTIFLGENSYLITPSDSGKGIRLTKELEKGVSNLSLVFETVYIQSLFDSKLGVKSGHLMYDKGGNILFKQIEENSVKSIVSKVQDLKIFSKNLVVKELPIQKDTYHLTCSQTNIGFQYCYFSDIESRKSLIYNLVFQYLVIFLGVSSLIGIVTLLLLRKFTSPIEKLTSNALELANGNLSVRNNFESNDEIGQLSNSFDYMAQKLEAYISEVQEKARMQEELLIANTVQDYFFPAKELIDFGKVKVKGLCQTASECGGDWWGVQEINGKIILFLGDATGHGVGSALITSAVHSTAHLLADFAKENEQVLQTDNIMRLLNKAVYSLGQEILMTFFVAVIDTENNKMQYTNASHNPPFIVNENTDKSEVLQAAIGRRLGEALDSEYETEEIDIESGDILLVYTDGITEAVNLKGRMYGERRLLKELKKQKEMGPSDLLDYFMQDMIDFCKHTDFDDDITLACMKVF